MASMIERTGKIEEIQYYEGREIEWRITDFYSIAEDAVIQSDNFSFVDSTWHFRLCKRAVEKPGFVVLSLINIKRWEYSVTYVLSEKKLDGSVNQLSKGILRRTNKKLADKIYIKLPEVQDKKRENVFTFRIILKRGSTDFDLPSELNKPKLKKLKKLDTLSENFQNLIANKDSCDTTLHLQDREYKVHRAILIARSSVFAAMFLHETSEKQTGIVNIPDCDPETFEEFLNFLYSGKLEEPSFRNARHLYETSEKYNVQELKEFCVNYLMENLTAENLCDLVIFADKYEERNLMSAAEDFFYKNLSKILQTSGWDYLVKNNYCLSKRLLTALSSKIKTDD